MLHAKPYATVIRFEMQLSLLIELLRESPEMASFWQTEYCLIIRLYNHN